MEETGVTLPATPPDVCFIVLIADIHRGNNIQPNRTGTAISAQEVEQLDS